jgi:hypothetical protein
VSEVSETAIKRKESPHTSPNAMNPGNHEDARGEAEVAGDTVEL